MPKKITLLIVVLLGISWFFYNKQTPPKNNNTAAQTPQVSKQEHSHDHSHKDQIKRPSPSQVTLTEKERPIKERLMAIKDLPLKDHSSKNFSRLVTFINSKNPYGDDPEAQEAHNFKAYQLKKEASLRVYALKRLSQSLNKEQARPLLEDIIANSKDKAITRIAKQVLEAKEKGEDYFENVKKGILSQGHDHLHD